MLDRNPHPVQRCLACGKSTEIPVPPECPHCETEGAWESLLGGAAAERRAAPPELVSLAQYAGIGDRRLPSGDPALDALLGGGWFPGESVLVHGPRGSGKSRLCLRWASALRPALVVCLEMPPGLTREVAGSSGAELGALYPVEELSGWVAAARRLGARAVLIDSISKTRRPADTLRAATAWAQAREGVALLVSHENARGGAAGGPVLEHDPDSVLRVSDPRPDGTARVEVLKRRVTPGGSVRLRVAAHPPPGRPPRHAPRLRLVR